ncbi:MAG: hypothetical protein LRY73_09510 [Bacillus sp. (in: Bacteria)]|nr:hypothetical protein [Bacillus sp. (in: firmicutes)]
MEKFDELYFQYSDRIYSYIFLMVGEKETAEDLNAGNIRKNVSQPRPIRGDSKFSTCS